jgi:hypothetical protein
MPRDGKIFSPRPGASAEPFADARRSGDANILVLLGLFAMADALLVVLWTLL